jgi:hypothetical protein
MSHGKIQLAPQSPLGNRVITISRPQHSDAQGDGGDPLFINVLRRRWMLLGFCALLSAAAGLLVVSQFSLPKAVSLGQLRYVELPPTLKGIYQPPGMLEFTEILKSNEIMTELARRSGQEVSAKDLRRRFRLQATRFSNIIDIEGRGRDGKQTIDMVNELMKIASETIATNRKQTLGQYRIETELQFEAAEELVYRKRDKVTKLRQERDARLSTNASPTTQDLLAQIRRVDEQLESLAMQRLSNDRQLMTLRSEVDALRKQIKSELLRGRHQQLDGRKKLYNPKSERYRQVEQIEQQLTEFEQSSDHLDYTIWRAKLEAIGNTFIGAIDAPTSAVVNTMERELNKKETMMEQIEFAMVPLESNRGIWERKRETLDRELREAAGESDVSTMALEEAEAQLDEAMATRSALREQLNSIVRGEQTDFSEMTVLTAASWQTTEASEGKTKLFVFTFAGCFAVLVMPVFALEHFFPSGDPATHAAKILGIPQVSRGTFVTHRFKHDRGALHAVNSEAMRLLALRIQQSVHGPGSMVLFSGLNHEKSSIPMISYLAECLARREERVLIIDACDRPQDSHSRSANDDSVKAVLSSLADKPPASANEPAKGSSVAHRGNGDETLPASVHRVQANGVLGLADFLHSRNLRPEEMISATSIPGVDIIPCGSTSFPREGLASSCLTALFDECRQRYTMILVAGPSTDHPSDLQMLSARADGILFTVPPSGRPAGKGEDVVRDLLDLGAPVIGIVS